MKTQEFLDLFDRVLLPPFEVFNREHDPNPILSAFSSVYNREGERIADVWTSKNELFLGQIPTERILQSVFESEINVENENISDQTHEICKHLFDWFQTNTNLRVNAVSMLTSKHNPFRLTTYPK